MYSRIPLACSAGSSAPCQRRRARSAACTMSRQPRLPSQAHAARQRRWPAPLASKPNKCIEPLTWATSSMSLSAGSSPVAGGGHFSKRKRPRAACSCMARWLAAPVKALCINSRTALGSKVSVSSSVWPVAPGSSFCKKMQPRICSVTWINVARSGSGSSAGLAKRGRVRSASGAATACGQACSQPPGVCHSASARSANKAIVKAGLMPSEVGTMAPSST